MACPSKVCISFPESTSNMFIMPSIAPLAMYRPSGLWNENNYHHSILYIHEFGVYLCCFKKRKL